MSTNANTIDIQNFTLLSAVSLLDFLLVCQANGENGRISIQLLVDAIQAKVKNGEDGKPVRLDVQGDNVMWQVEGDDSWHILIPIERIKGPKGDQGEPGQSIKGDQGEPGLPLEFAWRSTELGVRIKGQGEYQYVNLKGETGAKGADGKMTFEELTEEQRQSLKGDKGDKGEPGLPLEFHWDGTRLGVRVQGQESYQYVGLKGKAGAKGANGNDGAKGADGKSAYQQAQEAGYAGSEQEFIAVLLESARNVGSNTATSFTNLPINKRLVEVTTGNASSFSLGGTLSIGSILHIVVYPTAEFELPLPNSGDWVSKKASLKLKSGEVSEISVLKTATKYLITAY